MAIVSHVRRADWSAVARVLTGWRLDAAVTALSLWMIAGVAWDFRVHAHGISFAEEGFLTAPHVTFYSAFVAIAVVMGLATYARYRRGDSWWAAIPDGYHLGLLGVGLFVLGGPADFLWHHTLGFEVGVEALTSPSHLLLVVGATLFLSSPLRAAWDREDTPAALAQLPLLVSATFVGVAVTFFTVYSNPLVQPLGAPGGPPPDESFLGLLWFAAVVAALCLTLVQRFRLATGAFTLVLGLLGLLLTAVTPSYELWPAAIGAGLVGDALYDAVRDRWPTVRVVRLLGAAVPVALYTLYFGTVALLHGLVWSLHIWTGGIVSAGLVGLLVSYVVIPSTGGGTERPGDRVAGAE